MQKLKKDDYIHGGTQKDYYTDSDKENCNCPLCGADKNQIIGKERGLAVVKCDLCDLIYTNPRAAHAQENYFGDVDVYYNEARLIFNGKKKHHRDRNYDYELRKIKQIKPLGRLLDVGTNMGFFLRRAKALGWDTEGIEPSPALSQIATKEFNLKIHNGFLENLDLPHNTYDVITLIDVLEHVTNPKQLLAKCGLLIKNDGIIVIKVPNGNYNHLKQKLAVAFNKEDDLDIWDCCEHVVHYTPKTLEKMAAGVGLKVKTFFIPIPIHSPVWQYLVGHYYQYPSPFILDWKRIMLRNAFYFVGRIEKLLGVKINCAPDLMFVLEKD